jgi:hypothetical protein
LAIHSAAAALASWPVHVLRVLAEQCCSSQLARRPSVVFCGFNATHSHSLVSRHACLCCVILRIGQFVGRLFSSRAMCVFRMELYAAVENGGQRIGGLSVCFTAETAVRHSAQGGLWLLCAQSSDCRTAKVCRQLFVSWVSIVMPHRVVRRTSRMARWSCRPLGLPPPTFDGPTSCMGALLTVYMSTAFRRKVVCALPSVPPAPPWGLGAQRDAALFAAACARGQDGPCAAWVPRCAPTSSHERLGGITMPHRGVRRVSRMARLVMSAPWLLPPPTFDGPTFLYGGFTDGVYEHSLPVEGGLCSPKRATSLPLGAGCAA